MKFSEMPYTRPGAAQTVERYRDMARRAETAASGKELVELFRLHTQLDDGFATAYRLAQIRHTLDTRDESYDAENDFFDNAAPEVSNAQLAFYRAVLGNEHKQALAEAYAPILLDKMELAVSAASDEVLELMQQENALSSRYQKIKAGAQVEFDGKTLTLPGLDPYKQSLDRAVRRAAFEAEGGFYDRNREELDDIYSKMIENRNAQARKLGYDSYVPLSYKRMGRLGYGPKEVASFRDQVAKYVTPLAHESMKAQFARAGIRDARFYDTTVCFADGNPTPVGTADQLLAKAVQMYTELSPETARFIRFMNESELFDLVSRPGKATGGYCETIPAYGAPFVFSNFNGTSGDVDVLTHEAGHAFQAWVAAGQGMCQELASPSMESCEIHSMSMEFLTAPWHHLFFGGDARATLHGGRVPAHRLRPAPPHRRRAQRRLAGAGAQVPPLERLRDPALLQPGRGLAAAAAHLRGALLLYRLLPGPDGGAAILRRLPQRPGGRLAALSGAGEEGGLRHLRRPGERRGLRGAL